MPTSQQYQISKIVNLIVHLHPESVLDIGPGFGKYGLLCREYLELWDEKQDYRHFSKRIDCIEVFETYLTPIHRYVYNNCYVGNAGIMVEKLDHRYDLVLLIDVLEHFDKENGTRFIRDILKKNKAVIISVPKDIGHQGEMFHNPHEAHLAEWTPNELLGFSNGFNIPDWMSHLVFLSSSREDVDRLKNIVAPHSLIQLKRTIREIFSI